MNYTPPIKPKGIRKSVSTTPDLGRSVDSIVSMANEMSSLKSEVVTTLDKKVRAVDSFIENANKIFTAKIKEVNTTIGALEDTAVDVIKSISSIEAIKGETGKDANEDAIVKKVSGMFPTANEVAEIVLGKIPTEDAIVKKVVSKIPKTKSELKVVKEQMEIDPLAIIDAIMSLPEEKLKKLKLKGVNIDGYDQTIAAFRNQLARGYLHGGGGGSTSGGLFTPQGITTADVGGILKGTDLGTTPFTFQQLAIRELYPAVPPTIILSSVPSQGLREFGDDISSVDLSAVTAAETNPITLVQFYRDGSLIYTVPSPSPTGGTESYTDLTPVTTNTTYNAKVSDGLTGTIVSNTLTFSFVYPYLHGIEAPALAFSSMYADLTHQIATEGNKIELFAPNSQVMYFGYPATYPDLASILDQNNFETISNWTKRTGTIIGLDGSSQSYKVYEFNNLTGDGSTIQYTFKY